MIAAAVAVAAAVATAEPVAPRLLVQHDGAVYAAGKRLFAGDDAAWSPDGTLVAFARGGDLWLANADGSGRRPLTATPGVEESQPSWAPGGRTLVYTASVDGPRQIRLLRLGGGSRRIARSGGEEWSPTFSRDGRTAAFVSSREGGDRIYLSDARGANVRPFRVEAPDDPGVPFSYDDLRFAPDGSRLAYTADYVDETSAVVDDGTTRTFLGGPSPETSERRPVWSPDGARVAYQDAAGQVQLADSAGADLALYAPGLPLDWRRVPTARPLFPDLRQRPPSGLTVMRMHGRFVVGFTSLVDNVGPGILRIRGFRPLGSPLMTATQLVALASGGVRSVPGAGLLHYTVAPPHYHWHLLGFERYELRRASDFRVVVRDRKSGFCIADHYGIAPGVRHGRPRFLGNCAQFHPATRSIEEGASVGYTDRYPAFFHGQQLDLTHVRAGLYWLVHRANSSYGLRERRYDNDVASLLVRIRWPGGRRAAPRVTPLRACLRERC